MKTIMKKILTFNEFKDKLNDIDKYISVQEEFIKSSDENEGLQINYYTCILLHLKVQRNELLKNPRYFKYIEKLKKEHTN